MGLYNPPTISINNTSSAATVTNESAATSPQTFAANTNRKGLAVINLSTVNNLFLNFGSGTYSATNYSVKISPGGYYEVPFGHTGAVGYIWDGNSGSANFIEFT